MKYLHCSLPSSRVVLVSGSPSEQVSVLVVLFLMILIGGFEVFHFWFWFPDVEQPEIENIAIKKDVTINLFILSSLLYLTGLAFMCENGSVCKFLT
jgi:hypothetical protein